MNSLWLKIISKKRSKLLCLFLFFVLSNLSAQKIKIIYSGCINGVLEHCKCPNDFFGGLTNLDYIFQNENKDSCLVIDSGDFFSLNKNDSWKNSFLKKIYNLMPFDAFNVGEQDLVVYESFLKGKKNVISNNIKGCKDHILIEKRGVTFSIYGVIDYNFAIFDSYSFLKKSDFDSLNKRIKKDKEKGYITILLSHFSRNKERKLFLKLENIDLLISGHSGFKGLEIFDGRVYAGAGDNCEYLGILDLEVENGSLKDISGEHIMIHKDKFKRSSRVDLIIKEYDKGLNK